MSHPRLEHQTTSQVLELLHMDLMGPMQVESIGGKRYVLVVVDDFSRFTWVNFIREKSDTFDVFKELCTQLQREKGCGIVRIRSDHGTEFENSRFSEFCAEEGIKHEFSSPITPQQNGVVERKNRTLQESARVMLHAKHLPYRFWAEAMNTACHIHNRVTLRTGTTTTLYELWKGRKPTVKYFHVFGSKCYILSDRDYRRKMDPNLMVVDGKTVSKKGRKSADGVNHQLEEYDEEGNKLPKKRKYKTKDGDIIEIEDEPKIKTKIKKKDKKPKTMKTSDGKQIQLIEDDDEPSEIITDKKTGKKVKKRKIMNENGDIEEVKEIIESDEEPEYDENGKKLPRKKKYINKKGEIIELNEKEPSEEESPEEIEEKPSKEKETKHKIIKHIIITSIRYKIRHHQS